MIHNDDDDAADDDDDKRKKEGMNEFPGGMMTMVIRCWYDSRKVNGRQENDGKTWMKIPLKYGN